MEPNPSAPMDPPTTPTTDTPPLAPTEQEFRDLQHWLRSETPHPPKPLADYLLGSLRRALAWALDDLHTRLDPDLASLVGPAHEAAIDVTERALFVGRDARLRGVRSTGMRGVSGTGEAGALLEAVRGELAWVGEESGRLRRWIYCSGVFFGGGGRTAFAYWPSVRGHEVEGVRRGREEGGCSVEELMGVKGRGVLRRSLRRGGGGGG
ncbi:hypothetical protein LTR08_008905 [Meristemomyces frigidus]|nr:hypothetical protein LTR08_008905 [Meristemomyces frigidus]